MASLIAKAKFVKLVENLRATEDCQRCFGNSKKVALAKKLMKLNKSL
jgi:hypothetical protein